MPSPLRGGLLVGLFVSIGATSAVMQGTKPAAAPVAAAAQRIDLAEQLKAGRLKAVNREVSRQQDTAGAVHVSAKEGNGVVWLEGTDFSTGTIEIDIRGKDVLQQSFVGVAFHRKDDKSYEAVYLRPFNFRSDDAARHQHAVQYISLPDYDWPRLRKEYPEEFENPVDASVSPTAWVPVRVVVQPERLQVFVGTVTAPALEVRKLGQLSGGMVGLWVGNTSDGDFANLRITASK